MQHPFEQLKPEYTSLLAHMQPTRATQIDLTAKTLIKYIDNKDYKPGCDATGVPQIVAAASFEREASSNFKLNPAQGWPLNSRSRDVPYNGPFDNWTTAQIAAYKIDGLDKIGAPNWSWEQACYEEELFNGFGYRQYGVHSPYLWAGTSNYIKGKFTSDHGYDPNEVDTQLGVIPIMYRIVQLRPDLALPMAFPGLMGATPIVAPMPAPIGLHDAEALQTALNKLGADPQLTVDGNYGRMTRNAVRDFQANMGIAVDGLAGPATWSCITEKLADPAGFTT